MSEKTARRTRQRKTPKEPTAVEQPLMATLTLDANELGLLLQMLRAPAVLQLLEDPMTKHVAANLQMKAAQAAEVFPNPNGDQG